MSPPKNLEDIPQPARTPVPTSASAHVETVNIYNGRGPHRSARHADTAPVAIASPRATEAVAAMQPPDHLPVPQPLVTGTPREPGAPAPDAALPSGRLGA